MDLFTLGVHIVDIAVRLAVIYLLLHGFVRTYLTVFIYGCFYLLTSFSEVVVSRFLGRASAAYGNLYWADEVLLDLLLFLTVILLTYRASQGNTFAPAMRKALIVVVVVALTLPFLLGGFGLWSAKDHSRLSDHWFTQAGQIFNFGGALMNLVLWTTLIGSRQREPRLLAVSAGLGVAVTAQAIFLGVRLLSGSPVVREVADVFINVLGQITASVIWCWAFRPSAQVRSGATSSGY